jgi:hypothetical protein
LPAITGLQLTPSRPRAGRLVSLRVTLSGSASDGASVGCSASVGGRHLSTVARRLPSAHATPAAAACTWRVPRRSSGKTFRGSVTVRIAGRVFTRSVSRRVS